VTNSNPAASGPNPPPPRPAGTAIHLAIHGNGNHVTITTPAAESANPPGSRRQTWRRAWAIVVDLAIITGALASILTLLL